MNPPRLGTILVVCVLGSETGWGQSLSDFHLGTWGGSVRVDYRLFSDQVHSPGGASDVDSRQRFTREGLTLRNEGFYFLDPRLASGSLGLTFEAVQEHDTTNGVTSSRPERLVGYAFDALLLEGLPYNGRLYANRSENSVNQPFSRTDTTFENRGLTLQLREDNPLRSLGYPYLSASAQIEQQHTHETTTSATTQTFIDDERQDIVKLDAHNGSESADLDLGYLFTRVRNAGLPAASFDSQRGTLAYSLDFGPALSRRSDTHVSYYSRTSASRTSVLAADEQLRIEHDSNLSSTYTYALTDTETVAGRTVSQDASAEVRQRLYLNLASTVLVRAQQQQLPDGTRRNYAAQFDLAYAREIPLGGRVWLKFGGRGRVDDNRLQAAGVDVIDEAHAAPPSLGAGAGFLLNQPFVTASSVVVVDARGGARLPTSAGIDYEIQVEGNLTRILPLATSAVIRPGDPLLVSYTFEVNPDIRYSTVADWISGSIDFHWIALTLDHQQYHQTLISGQDNGFLQDLRQDKAQIDLRGEWSQVQASASAAFSRYDSTRLVYDQREFTQFTSYQPWRPLTLALNLDRTDIDYSLPVHRTDSSSARASLDYFLGGWTATGLLSRRIYKDTLQAEEQVNEARLGTRLMWGKLTLTGALTAGHRSRGGFRTSNYGVGFSAVRQL